MVPLGSPLQIASKPSASCLSIADHQQLISLRPILHVAWLYPCYSVVDEFSALRDEGRHVVPLLARTREAGVACVVATQGLADLARVDRALPQEIVQNTTVRILLRQGSSEDALAWARHGGELEREELSRRTDNSGNDVGEGYARLAARRLRQARGAASVGHRRSGAAGGPRWWPAPADRAGEDRPATALRVAVDIDARRRTNDPQPRHPQGESAFVMDLQG